MRPKNYSKNDGYDANDDNLQGDTVGSQNSMLEIIHRKNIIVVKVNIFHGRHF